MSLPNFVLKPTSEEVAKTRVLFLARHAEDGSDERRAKYGYHVFYHQNLLQTLRDIGFNVTPAADFAVLFGPLKFDFLYAIHSHALFEGHELLAPVIAAYRGVPCLGPTAPMRAISEDKVLAKQVAASLGIEVAKHHVITHRMMREGKFSAPGTWILKPRGGIASDAIMKVESEFGWREALASAADPRHEGREFIAEEFVPGQNFTVPVIEGFPPFAPWEEQGRPGDNVLTNEGKRGLNPHYASFPYEGPGAREAMDATQRMASAVGPFDYARFDYRYDAARKRLVFIEVNFVCNMAPASVIGRSVELMGIDYQSLVGHIVATSLRRQRKSAG